MLRAFKKLKPRTRRLMIKLQPGSRDRSEITSSQSGHPKGPDPGKEPDSSATSIVVYITSPTPPPDSFSHLASAIKELLTAIQDGSDLFLPLQAALGGVVSLSDIFASSVEAAAEFKKLKGRLIAFNSIADVHQDKPLEGFQAHLKTIARSVQALWEAVEQRPSRNPGLTLELPSDIELDGQLEQLVMNDVHVRNLLEIITDLLEVFEVDDNVTANERLTISHQRLASKQRAVEIQSPSSTIVDNTSSTKYNYNRDVRNNNPITYDTIVPVQAENPVIQRILTVLSECIAFDAASDAQPLHAGCKTGTREGVLSMLVTWVKDDPTAIFWLNGMPGTGKTSIAVTICRILQEDPAVVFGGGYFCSRSTGSIARTDVRRILPTLAMLLANQSSKFAEALATELENDSKAGHKPVDGQIDPLLRRPLNALVSLDRPIVFVIDALDECADELEMAELLTAIANLECNVGVKFILTSRPELYIRETLISNHPRSTTLELRTISIEELTSDIRLFITDTLQEAGPDEGWYTNHDIETLVNLSDGLFIFASTVLRYVLDGSTARGRAERLHKVTSTKIPTAATAPLDQIYEHIMLEASRSDIFEDDELRAMQLALASILAARTSLSIHALADILDIGVDFLRSSLAPLNSVVYIPSEDMVAGVRTLHASFGDYMLMRAAQRFRISASLGDEALARGCLGIIKKRLHFNVAQSTSSYEPNPRVPPASITLAVAYACLQWAYHVAVVPQPSELDEEIAQIFRPRFLFWLEVISILNKVQRGAAMLAFAAATVRLPELSQFFRDANSFVASSSEVIERSAPHIYLSALPFAAKDSLIYKTFTPLCTGVVSIATVDIDRDIGCLALTLTGHEGWVRSVTYSPDGWILASGSGDGTVRIWDTRTGDELQAPLRSGDGAVRSVAFAPDGKHVISGTDGGTVCIWDITAGRAVMEPLRGHNGTVWSVACSPSNDLIASVSEDATVRLWNAQTGELFCVFHGHTKGVRAVAFLPNGQLVASGSDDKTIRLWSLQTGEAFGETILSIGGKIRSLAVSPDGLYLAAGSPSTSGVRVWNLETRQLQTVLDHPSSVTSLAFAPDGLYLVSAGWQAICFWDWRAGQEVAPSIVQSDWVNSVSFSPDGLYMSSASSDSTIRIWNSGTGQSAVQPPNAHESAINSIAVSADGKFIVSGSNDCSVRVWNAETGKPMLSPLLGHDNWVLSVAISSDGLQVASASVDRTIRRWSAVTGEVVGQPLRGHEAAINAIIFLPDSQWLASGSDDGTVRVWHVATGMLLTPGPLQCYDRVLAIALSPDGQIIAAGNSRGYIYFWQVRIGQAIHEPLRANSRSIRSVAFSTDGLHVVSGSEDRTVRVWNLDAGQPIMVYIGHTDWVCSIANSPDGRLIVSGSDDRTIRIWKAETGSVLATIHGHEQPVRSLKFSPDGRSIVSCADDQTIRVWDVEEALLLTSRGAGDLLARAKLKNGWFVGPLHELVLWVPQQYHKHVQKPSCKLLIGSSRVVIIPDTSGLYSGDKWTSCWLPMP